MVKWSLFGQGQRGLGRSMDSLHVTDSRPDERAAPTVVLLHGMLLDSSVWGPTVPLLPDCRVITIDLPGHGQSRDVAATTLDDWVRAVGETIDHLDLNRPVLVGSSAGAIVALELAMRQPGLAAGAVLMGCFAHATAVDGPFCDAMTDFSATLGQAAADGDLTAVAQAAVPSWLGPFGGTVAPDWLLGMAKAPPRGSWLPLPRTWSAGIRAPVCPLSKSR